MDFFYIIYDLAALYTSTRATSGTSERALFCRLDRRVSLLEGSSATDGRSSRGSRSKVNVGCGRTLVPSFWKTETATATTLSGHKELLLQKKKQKRLRSGRTLSREEENIRPKCISDRKAAAGRLSYSATSIGSATGLIKVLSDEAEEGGRRLRPPPLPRPRG